jgi:hypothetical protein
MARTLTVMANAGSWGRHPGTWRTVGSHAGRPHSRAGFGSSPGSGSGETQPSLRVNARTRACAGRTWLARLVASLALAALAVVATHAQTPAPAGPGTVTLSLAEYNRLVDRGASAPRRIDDPPIPAVVSRAELNVRATNDVARGTLTLQGEVFRSGPTSVPLLSGGTVLDAQLAGVAVPLIYDGGTYKAILPGGKAFTLTLTWATPITSEPGRAAIVLPTVAASSIRASLDAPGDHADVRLQPGVITRRTSAAGRTQVEMTLEAGTSTRVTWSSRETAATAAAPRELRMLSEVKTLVTIGEVDIKLATLFDVTVVQGEPARFEIHLPPGFEVASASGASVEGTPERNSSGTLTLTVREPARRRHQFLVTLERSIAGANTTASLRDAMAQIAAAAARTDRSASGGPSADAAATAAATDPGAGVRTDSRPDSGARADAGATHQDIPLPWLEGAQRETGEAAIEGVGTLDLNAEERAPLHRIDASEVSGPLQSLAREALLAAFRYQRRGADPVALALNVQRFPEALVLAAIAERAVVTTLVTTQGRALTEVTLTMRNQGQPFLKVGLPAGATLLSADVAGGSVKPVEGADGARVPLLRTGFRPSGPYTVSFVYVQSGAAFEKKGDAVMTLARFDLPISVLEWELFLPDRYEVKKFDGDVLASERLPYLLTSVEQYDAYDAVASSTVAGRTGGGLTESITIVPEPVEAAKVTMTDRAGVPQRVQKSADKKQDEEPSVNVQNLQRRVAGVLPVRVDVPRAGHSYHFVRPLVVDEDTSVRFRYRTR